MPQHQQLGIDGCRGGWVAAEWRGGKRPLLFRYLSRLEEIIPFLSGHSLVYIDIPIGLSSRGRAERLCDLLARSRLTRRKSSVFRVPVRKAVYGADYETACRMNRRLSQTAISRQTWAVTPKIREADLFLAKHSRLKPHFYESHPELCFTALNRGRTPLYSKKEKEGRRERIRILSKWCRKARQLFSQGCKKAPHRFLAPDDVLDAMALAVSAVLSSRQGIGLLPEKPPEDDRGLAMRIAFPDL